MIPSDAGYLYPLPFTPRDYFVVADEYLAHLQRPGCVDSMLLLLSLAQKDGRAYLSAHGPEGQGARKRSPDRLNLVSHVTFRGCLEEFASEGGWLKQPDEKRRKGELWEYEFPQWPHFNGAAVFYIPRSYIEQRWPARLRTGGFAVRAALIAAFACVSKESTCHFPSSPELPFTFSQLKTECRKLFPHFDLSPHLAVAVQHLQAIGVLEQIESPIGAGRQLKLNVAQLRAPDAVEIHVIVDAAGLDVEREPELAQLVGALLRASGLPASAAGRIMQMVHAFDPLLAAPDAQRALAEYVQTRRHVSPVRLRSVMREFLNRRKGTGLHWVDGGEVRLRMARNAAGELTLPPVFALRPQATQLVAEWNPRRGRGNAQEAAVGAMTLELRQDDRVLMQATINSGRQVGESRIVLDANVLHGRARPDAPVTVLLRTTGSGPRLGLRVRFRILTAEKPE